MKFPIIPVLMLLCLTASSQNLRQVILKKDPKLEGVVIIKCKLDPTLFITILQDQVNWWERLEVVKFSGNKIKYHVKFDVLPDGQSIDTARQITLKGSSNLFIEVFSITHMGNGFYHLYKKDGRRAKLLVKTRAVDCNLDGAYEGYNHRNCSLVFKNDRLTATYRDINKDGYADIKLSGTIQIIDDDAGKTILKQYPAQKIFFYSKAKRRFVEDLKMRRGFKRTDD